MLLVQIEKYSRSFHAFGDPNHNDAHAVIFTSRKRLIATRCDMRRLFDDHRMRKRATEPRESFEVMGLTLVKALSTPKWVLSDERNPPEYSVADLIAWYVDRNVEIPFEEWIRCNPLVNRGRDRSHISVFTTYDGELYVFYIEAGKLFNEQIVETSFVRNGTVTPLSRVLEKHKQVVQRRYEEALQLHEKLLTAEFTLPTLLDGSEVLACVNDR